LGFSSFFDWALSAEYAVRDTAIANPVPDALVFIYYRLIRFNSNLSQRYILEIKN
jgi:hypothetical protein